MKISQCILIFFAAIALIFEGYLGVFPLVGFVVQVILIASVTSLFVYLLSPPSTRSYRPIFVRSILIVTAMMGVLITFISGFIAYHIAYPAKLSDITLSDGKSTVVFIQMSHIASQQFFDEKNTQLQALEKQGYTFLVEGVQSGTLDNHEKFDAYMGFRFTDTLYDTLAGIVGYTSQDNTTLYSGIASGSLAYVDLSIDQIVSMIGDTPSVVSGELPDIEKDIIRAFDTLSPNEKKLLNYSFRALLNWSLKNSSGIETRLMQGEKSAFFHTIIQKRNDPIVEYIRANPEKKIAVVYGALHFNGVYESLQQISPSWNILDMKHSYPYR